jgi:diphosphate--fructose-6-phosphate 1-phosphotransferase
MDKKKDYAFDLSDYQKHRMTFVPGCPFSLIDPVNTKVHLERSAMKQPEENFKQLFPTLLSKDMEFLELKVNEEHG